MSFEWLSGQSPDVLADRINQIVVNLPEAVREVLDEVGKEMTAWAKQNAPWKDVTGMARNGLTYEVTGSADAFVLTFGHTVTYGKFLELAHSGRFAIIASAIQMHLPALEAKLRGVVG